MSPTLTNAYALIIGVDQNANPAWDLPTVAKDVNAVYDVLTHPQRCGYHPDNVKLIHGVDATKAGILNGFDWLIEKAALAANDTIFVYYSGHGMLDTNTDQYYFVPFDTPADQPIENNAIRAPIINRKIAGIEAQRLLVVLDCCHANGMNIKGINRSHIDPTATAVPLNQSAARAFPPFEKGIEQLSNLAQGFGRAVLNSSTGSELSYIRQDGRMSIFTYHLIEALTGYASPPDGSSTVLVTDVMSYVTRKVASTAESENRQQTPVMRTTGVFPVALIAGGKGITPNTPLPSPLDTLPSAEEPAVADMSNSILFNQTGQIIYGNQINAETIEQMGNIGDTIQVENGDFMNGNQDTYTFTGNMQGAMININAHLENVQQTIQALPHGTSAEKEALQAAVTDLQALLDRLPDAHAQAAELIATRLEQLLLEIEDEEPDPISIESKKDRLLNAAEQIVNVATRVLPITQQIIHLVGLVVPLAA